ncbi:MAG: tetratricopeptide repeat protein, partial [Candidatus Neomarinimicrobiota bacterium]
QLEVRGWRSQNIKIPVKNDPLNKEGFIEWTVKPTYMNAAIKVQDLMIIRMISDNAWRYPIYFAVTVSPDNRIGLDPYLEMEGLAFRLLSHPGESVNVEKMEENLMTDISDWSCDYQPGYRFRNLDNPEVYYNPNIIKLLQNYRSAYMQLAVSKYFNMRDLQKSALVDSARLESMRGEVLTVLNRMEEKLPIRTIPMTSRELYLQYGRLYGAIGEGERMKTIVDDLMTQPGSSVEDKIGYGWAYVELNEVESGRRIFEELYNANPTDPQVVGNVFQAFQQMNLDTEAIAVLEAWLDRNPDDKNARALLDRMHAD